MEATNEFHFTPDFFQLLVETIPLLCRGYQDTLLFFEGAGVEFDTLADLWHRAKTDPDSINKYDIVRTTLQRLNQRYGRETLRQRRKIVRRIVEFEDFTSCWPNNRDKADLYVRRVRDAVHKKDSFTRMNLERVRERQKHRVAQKKRLESILEQRKQLEPVHKEILDLFKMHPQESQKRGKMLEGVLNRLFAAYDIAVREAFQVTGDDGDGTVAQIDGLIELDGHLYLVEMKWWSKPIGKPQVAAHLINLFGRDARGIFISASPYTKPAVAACREALGWEKVCVLCELEEVVVLPEQQRDLTALIRHKTHSAIIDKNPLTYPTRAGLM